MKKNVILLSLLVLFIQFNLNAQDNKSSRLKLKAYYNFNRLIFNETFEFSNNQYLWSQPEITVTNTGEFSLGAVIEKNQNRSYEFEIMPLSFHTNTLNEVKAPSDEYNWQAFNKNSTSINSRLRFQYNYIYSKRSCNFYLGLSSMFSYFFQNYKPTSSYEFHESYNQFALIFGLTPGIEIPIKNNLIWSIDVPVGIAGINMQRMNTQNPTIILNERKQFTFNGEFWHQGFQVRVGLGFRL